MTKRSLKSIAIPAAVVLLLIAALIFIYTMVQDTQYYYDRGRNSIIGVSPWRVKNLNFDMNNIQYRVGAIGNTIEATVPMNSAVDPSIAFLVIYLKNDRGGYDLWHQDYLKDETTSPDVRLYGMNDEETTATDIRESAIELTAEKRYTLDAIIPAPREAAELLDRMFYANLVESIALVDELLAQYPDDLFLNILKLDLIAEKKEEATHKDAVDKFANKFTTGKEDIADYVVKVHRGNLTAYDSIRKDTNIVARGMGRDENYSTDQLHHFLLDYEVPPSIRSAMRSVLMLRSEVQPPSFFTIHMFTRTQRVLADFYLMSGYPEKAHDLTMRLSRLGIGMMGSGEDVVTNVIGFENLSSVTKTTSQLYVDGYTDAADLKRDFPSLLLLHDQATQALNTRIIDVHPVINRFDDHDWMNTTGRRTRGNVALSHLALATTAASIRHYQLLNGNWPTTPSAGILLKGALADPFYQKGLPLHIAPVGNDMMVYSIGPDHQDGGGSIEYDPTNGTISAGDVTLTIYKNRKYRFPTEPIKPRNREEFLALYSNGLLPDPFADTPGRSYIISDTTPPFLWSVGPDVDESESRSWNINSGNLTADHGAASTLESQWMHFINEPQQATYDPTNGTVSDGNIYWDFLNGIPRIRNDQRRLQ